MPNKPRNAMSGFEQVELQNEHEDLQELARQLFVAVEIASDYLPQHWEMNSVPLNRIEDALDAVNKFNLTHKTKIGY